MSFYESPRFPDCYAFGAQGGPTYFTELVSVASGYEQRSEVWRYSRAQWEVGHVAKPKSEWQQLRDFFHAMAGRLHGFRFKDWTDFEANSADGSGYVNADGHPTGEPTAQLFKRYQVLTGVYRDRAITKPIAATVALQKDGVAAATGWALDSTTGVVTFSALATATVNAITKANPGVATTSAAHGFSNGQVIYLSGVAGMTEVNDRAFTIAGVTSTTFQLGEDTTSYGTFTGTATAARYPQASESWTWTGEFDVPARFDTDQMRVDMIDRQGGEGELLIVWQAIPIIEIRIDDTVIDDGGGGEEEGMSGFSAGFDEGFA
jgi:uncharacterized protein (TIGR02217 family)